MRFFLKIFVLLLGAMAIFAMHLMFNGFLSYPFNRINIIFIILLWLIILYNRSEIIWLTLPAAFFIELFASVPFGINSLSLVLSLSVLNWLALNIFTNRSAYIVFLAGILAMSLYRGIYILFLLALNFFGYNFSITWDAILRQILVEIGMTALCAALFYFFAALFLKRLSPKYLNVDKSFYGQRFV